MNTFTPIGKRVLVKRKEQAKMIGLIHLPTVSQENNRHAVVVSIGAGKDEDGKDLQFNVKAGDTILLPQRFLCDVEVNREMHILIHENEIVAVIEE